MSWMPSLLGPAQLEILRAHASAAPRGALVEVGVYRGGSAAVLHDVAVSQGRRLFLYDTFRGIPHADPDKGDAHKVGDFADGLTRDQARVVFPYAVVLDGVFPDDFAPPEDVAFAHLDCDQYRSVKDSLAALWPVMVPGGLILLDDYCLAGCERAVREVGRPFEVLPDGRALFRC